MNRSSSPSYDDSPGCGTMIANVLTVLLCGALVLTFVPVWLPGKPNAIDDDNLCEGRHGGVDSSYGPVISFRENRMLLCRDGVVVGADR